jgi:hypothetical protein
MARTNKEKRSADRNKNPIADKMVPANDPRVRKPGLTASEQNKLRQTLYTAVWERIDEAMSKESYLEAISYVDSIIADRIFALVQTIRHEDELQYPMMGPGDAATAFQKEMKTRKTSYDLVDEKCRDSIGEMKNHWLNARNTAVHGFVVVSPLHDESLEERLENMKTAAVSGIALAKRIQTDTRRAIASIKKIG